MNYRNNIRNAATKLRFSKIFLSLLVVTSVGLVCWQWLRPVHATLNVVSPPPPPSNLITGTAGDDVITVIARDSSYNPSSPGTPNPLLDGVQDFTVSVNGGAEQLFTNQPFLLIDGLEGNDEIVVREPAPNQAAWNVQVFVAGGPPAAGDNARGDKIRFETPGTQTVTYNPNVPLASVPPVAGVTFTTPTAGGGQFSDAGASSTVTAVQFLLPLSYQSSPGGVEEFDYAGEGGNDTLIYNSPSNSNAGSNLVYTPGDNADAGTITGNLSGGAALTPLTFSNLGTGNHISFTTSNGGSTDRLNVKGSPNAVGETFTVTPPNGGTVQIARQNGATNPVTLPIFTASVTNLELDGLGGSDILNVTGVLPYTSLVIDDGVTVNLSAAAGAVTANLGDNTPGSSNPNTVITGYGGLVTLIDVNTANLDVNGHQLTATVTRQNDNVIYTPTGPTAGTFYDGIGSGNNLVPNTVFNITNATGDFRVFNDPGGNADQVTLRGTDARDLFEIAQGPGTATVLANNVTALLPLQLGISAEILNVEGLGGQNTFQVIPAPGIAGQAQDNMLINIDGGTTEANNSLVLGTSFGANPGTLPANQFVVVNKNPQVNSGTLRVFTNAVANPDINYKNVQVVSPNVSGGSVSPNLLVIGPDLNEPNELLGTSTFLGSTETIQVQHATVFPNSTELPGTPADNDYYRVIAKSTGPLNFQVLYRTVSSALLPAGGNLSLEVRDALGNILGTGTTQATLQATAGQSYFLHVFGATAAAVNGYDVLITNSPLTVSGRSFNAVEGLPFSNQIVGTFNSGAPATNFTAKINWGDGTASSTGTIVANGPGAFNVLGSHTYAEEGSYNVVVQVTDTTTGLTQQGTSTATVADAPLSVSSQSAGSNTSFTGSGGTNVAGGAFNSMSAFQAAIGGVNNGATASPQNGGFRTINWDGVALTANDGTFTNQVINAHTVGIPLNRFQERGMNFAEVYAVSDDGFTSVNPGAAGQFPAFSSPKTFAMFNDNSIDFNFVLPSTHGANVPIQAVTRGFGAIFLDVETPNTTSIEYFNGTTSLGKFFVPVAASGQPQFFGVLFANPVVTNVTITLGNATLFSFDGSTVTAGPADAPPGTDLVVTDDFVYPEPQAVSTGININAIAGTPFTARVASFTDADPNGQISDYSVVIDWGDGTTSGGGVTPNAAQPESGIMDTSVSISPAVNGGFDVTGTHTYAAAGTFTVTTSIRDIGGASISAQSTATVSGQPALSINDVTQAEGNSGTTNFVFTVTQSATSPLTTTVNFASSNGTATAGTDYQLVVGTLTFAPGVTTQTITVPVTGDTQFEPDENFFVSLTGATNASITKAVGVGTITNDDPAPATPSLSIGNVTVTEGNSGTANAAFTVTLSSASSQSVNVDYVTSDGTATAPSDYDSQAGTLSFPPGVTTRTINVAVKGDTVPEPNETFLVTLLNPVNSSIAVAQGTGTINDDDESGFVQFSSPTATVAEDAGSVSLTVTRTGDTSGVTTVNFETSDGTAVQKTDYIFNSSTVQFNPGDTSKTIKILLIDDVFVEGSENFKVTLANVSGPFVIANPNQVTVTITDNDSVPPVSNPIDDPTFFVRQHYLDFLGREPDASGQSFWASQITSCGANPSCIAAARVNVSAAFFLSIEYQETSGAAVRIQRVAFGKFSADPALRVSYLQFMRDTRQIGAGVIVGQPGFDTLLEQNKQAYALQVVNSPAFLARFPIMPAAAYVDALIASTGVNLSAAERTAAINAFGAGGTLGRVAALRSIADSSTVRQAEMIPSFVLAEYFGYLRRNPTDAPDFSDVGFQFWLAKLNAFNGDFIKAEMVKAFITSNEYRQRFGP